MYDFFLIPNVTFSFEDTRKMPGRGGEGGVSEEAKRQQSKYFVLFILLPFFLFWRLAYSAFFSCHFFSRQHHVEPAPRLIISSRQPAGSSSPVFCGKFLIAKQIMRAISTSTSNKLLLFKWALQT